MAENKDIEKTDETPSLFDGTNIKAEDAFMVVTLGFLREPFMSSDMKYLCVLRAIKLLQDLGYTEKDVNDFKAKMGEVMSKMAPKNDFMG